MDFMQKTHTAKMKFPAILTIGKHWITRHCFKGLAVLSLIGIGSFWWIPPAFPDVIPESEIEMLDVLEVIGTKVTKTPRTIIFSLPQLNNHQTNYNHLMLPDLHINTRTLPTPLRLLLDHTGEVRRQFTNVQPLQVDRPLYPRLAREQGWQGKVILRARITPNGKVKHITVQESSGFPVLDESAMNTVILWSFEPAKNGEFPVSSVVDLPIRFDLLQ
jgi:TonB family protein